MIVDIHSHIKRNPAGQEEEEKKLLLDMEKNGIDFRVVSALDGWPVEAGNRIYQSWCPLIRTVWPAARSSTQRRITAPKQPGKP